MVYVVNAHTNATSKRWHLWEIDLRFALNSTPGWETLQRDTRRKRRREASGLTFTRWRETSELTSSSWVITSRQIKSH